MSKRDDMVSVRFSAQELVRIDEVAASRGQSRSAFLREALALAIAHGKGCDVAGCFAKARDYYRNGSTVSNSGAWTSNGSVPRIEHHRLCPEHAMAKLGMAWTCLPGDAA